MKFFIILAAMMFLLSTARVRSEPVVGTSSQIDRLADVVRGLPPRIQHQMLIDAYRKFYPKKVGSGNLPEARNRFDAAVTAAFYSKDGEISLEAARLYDLLDAQYAATQRDLGDVIGVLVKSRKFKIANSFALSHGLAAIIPTVLDGRVAATQAPAVIKWVGNSLVIESVSTKLLDSGVVIVAGPLCHFTRAASDAIVRDADLRGDLKSALWIVPPETRLHLEEIEQWNAAHADQQMLMVYDWLAWSQITDWATPGFYFFHGNKLVAEMHGWPINGSKKKELIAVVEKWKSARR